MKDVLKSIPLLSRIFSLLPTVNGLVQSGSLLAIMGAR